MSAPALRPEIAKGGGNEGISRKSGEIVEKVRWTPIVRQPEPLFKV